MSINKRAEASPQETVTELKEMVVDYAKQETVDPLKRLAHWFKWSLLGAVLLVSGSPCSVSGSYCGSSRRRSTAFQGGKSWIPYLITFGGLLVVLVMAGFGLKRSIDLSDRSDS